MPNERSLLHHLSVSSTAGLEVPLPPFLCVSKVFGFTRENLHGSAGRRLGDPFKKAAPTTLSETFDFLSCHD